MDKKIEHEYTREIVCPNCGYKFKNSYDYELDESGDNLYCDECETAFFAYVSITVEYITETMKKRYK